MPPKREPPRQSTRIDGVAWILLIAGMLVALCILSYEPDSPAQNLLGKPGVWLAGELFAALGLGVHVLLASWFVLVVSLLLRNSWRLWARRLFGWLVLVPCAAIGADWIGPALLQGGATGPGGAVGALLGDRLRAELGPIGATLAFSVVTAAATLLALDFLLVRLFRTLWTICQTCGFVVGSALRWTTTPRPTPIAKKSDKAEKPEKTGVPISHSGVPNITITVPKPAEPTPEPTGLRIHHVAAPEPAVEPETVDAHRFDDFELPPITLLADSEPFRVEEHEQRLRDTATLLEKTFLDFDLRVKVVGINTGPVITQYEIQLETGMRVSKVTVLADDLALHMKVPSVRIVAPIPGKNAVGIEVPNESRVTVRLKELYLGAARKMAKSKLPLLLGKDTEGRPLVQDLAELPHLLIAGTTGTGKSVCLNSIITSILMTRRPDECKMILIDPKMTELTEYGKIPHMMHPVVTDMKKAEAILAWAVDKMEERYELLSRCRVRNIATYNELGEEEIKTRLGAESEEEQKAIQAKLPYIVIVVDELADLMMMMKREVESHIIRLAQKSRAAGIHLVLATQKPTVDVITGLIKSNLPGRICFKVSSRTDSRVVLDEMGADKLLGKGDMLFLQPGTSILVRAQGTYIADAEITKIVEHLGTDAPCYDPSLVNLKPAGEEGAAPNADKFKPRDELYQQAVSIVVREGRGSCSLLQRALGIGYGRAARLIDFMAEDGIVGAYNGSNAREVIISPDDWDRMAGGTAATAS
jgi:DNA segregation ATPase FtsK/SpoIIIE, S-DNA-T family